MSIRRLMKQGNEEKKGILKSFRLRGSSKEALENLASVSSVSQNETLNIILEESYADYKVIQEIENYLESTISYNNNYYIGAIASKCFNQDDYTYCTHFKVISTEVGLKFNIINQFNVIENSGATHPFIDRKELVSGLFHLNDLSELLDYGLNSEFKVEGILNDEENL